MIEGTPIPQPEELVQTLTSNNLRLFEETWTRRYDGRYNSELSHLLRDQTLPLLAGRPQYNRFPIAVCLSFIDSRTLGPALRRRIGLSPRPNFDEFAYSQLPMPQLFKPSITPFHRKFASQCSVAESFLTDVFNRGYHKSTGEYTVNFRLLGCIVGKRSGFKSGVCYKTTEFPNGVVFFEGVWYLIRSNDLIHRIDVVSQLADRQGTRVFKVFSDEHGTVLYSQDMVIMEDCGGVWQPTRNYGDRWAMTGIDGARLLREKARRCGVRLPY